MRFTLGFYNSRCSLALNGYYNILLVKFQYNYTIGGFFPVGGSGVFHIRCMEEVKIFGAERSEAYPMAR